MSVEREESLFHTVSEDHRKRDYPQYLRAMSAPYSRAGGMVAAYEGAVLGGGDKLFGMDQLELWLRRHRYAAFDMHILLPIAQLCLEYAVRKGLTPIRPGIPAMAEAAARELLWEDPLRWRHSSQGWIRIYWLTQEFPRAACPENDRILRNFDGQEEMLALFLDLLRASGDCTDARALVEQAVLLYKKVFTRYFAPDHGMDALSLYDISGDDTWEGDHALPELSEPIPPEDQENELIYEKGSALSDELILSEEALAAVPDYLAKNFGPSFLTEKELEELETSVCVDIHEGRKLLLTDGLSEEAYQGTSASAQVLRTCREGNLQMVEDHRDAVQQGIRAIEQAFRNTMNLKNDPEIYRADRGVLVNSQLWKVGRVQDPQLFHKVVRQDNSTIAVDLLIDASGSQGVRQAMVAMQSYLFSAALSRVDLPHRVMSYCTYGNHTVLRRFRDYDDRGEADGKILEYRATSNNRDGLALAAAGVDLLRRREDHKILIVFSDGLPNDMVSGRKRKEGPPKYVGEAAIRDTCAQVRKLRRAGVHVIGIFLGEEGELENERMIYGSSFLRIRRAEDFGGSAGKRLRETLMLL